jgi:hypothetical protein
MTALLPAGDYVFANWGAWKVWCSNPWCDAAMQVYQGQNLVTCLECETTMGPLIWPNDPEGIEALLMLRPAKLRNWHPGETLHDLLAENVAHGILPPDPDRSQMLMTVSDDDRIISGTLGQLIRSDIRRHQIEAATYG